MDANRLTWLPFHSREFVCIRGLILGFMGSLQLPQNAHWDLEPNQSGRTVQTLTKPHQMYRFIAQPDLTLNLDRNKSPEH
jgi:hypothetical protein